MDQPFRLRSTPAFLSFFLLLASPALAHPQRPQTPQPPFPYKTTNVRVESIASGEPVTLAGTLVVPGELDEGIESLANDDGRMPCVVLLTGSGGQDRDETIAGHKPFAVIADHLARRGIASLRLDDRGVGESQGKLAETTLPELAGDALAAASFCAAHDSIDPGRIALVGHSEGAVVAAIACAMDSESGEGLIDACVMLAGFACNGLVLLSGQNRALLEAAGFEGERLERNIELHDAMIEALERGAGRAEVARRIRELAAVQMGFDPEGAEAIPQAQQAIIDQITESQSNALTAPIMRSMMREEPTEWLEKVEQPVLAIFGELDLQVLAGPNTERIRAAMRAGGNEAVTIVTLQGLNHLLQPAVTGLPHEYGMQAQTMAPAALDTLGSWLVEGFSER